MGAVAIGHFTSLAAAVVDDVGVFVGFGNEFVGLIPPERDQQFGAGVVSGAAEVDVLEGLEGKRELAVHHVIDAVFLVGRDAWSQHQLPPFVSCEIERLGGRFDDAVLNILESEDDVHKRAEFHRDVEDFFFGKVFDLLQFDCRLGFADALVGIDGEDSVLRVLGREEQRPVEGSVAPALALGAVFTEEQECRAVDGHFCRFVGTTIIRSITVFPVLAQAAGVAAGTLEAPEFAIGVVGEIVEDGEHLVGIPLVVHVGVLLAIDEGVVDELDNLGGQFEVDEEVIIDLIARGRHNEFVYLGDNAGDLIVGAGLEANGQDTLLGTDDAGVSRTEFALCARFDAGIVSDDDGGDVFGTDILFVLDQVVAQDVVEGVHHLKHLVNLLGGEEASDGHVFLITGTVHTCVLDDGIHLELLGVTAIEEAEHIVEGDTSVEDGAANEKVCGTCQFELTTVIEHRADSPRIGGVDHIDAVVLVPEDAAHPGFDIGPGREFFLDETSFPSLYVGLPEIFVGILLQVEEVDVGVLGLEEGFTDILNDGGYEFLLPFVVFLVDFYVDEAGRLVGLAFLLFLEGADGRRHQVTDDGPAEVEDIVGVGTGGLVVILALTELLDAEVGYLFVEVRVHRVFIL